MFRKEDVLRDETYKEDGMEIEKRVFYTLCDGKSDNMKLHRICKAIAMLMKTLRENDILAGDEIDEILLECIQ